MRIIRQSSDSISRECRDAFLFGDNLIAQFFIIQSELSDQQRERLTSALSLRNISLENYSYENKLVAVLCGRLLAAHELCVCGFPWLFP